MDFIKTILRQPMRVFLIVLAICIFGISSLTGMDLEYMPDMSMPMELVLIYWPGADADSIERLVTEDVEDECETLSGVNTVVSSTSDNYTMIQLIYDYETDLDEAYSDLRSAMDTLALSFPDDVEDPVIMEIDMDAMSTMIVSVSSDSSTDIQSYLNDNVVPALESLTGVAQVTLTGAGDEYVRLVVDESKLEQYGLTFASIGSAITYADYDMPVGDVTLGSQDLALTADGNIDISANWDILDVPIETSSGQIIKVRDVLIDYGLYTETSDSISRYNGNGSIMLSISKNSTASTVSVCNAIEEVFDEYTGVEGLSFRTIYSEGDSVIDSIVQVVQTLAIGVVLTMVILFLFFGDLRASIIVGCSMPLSILLAVIFLSFLGYDFDMITGVALIIAIGMIVDNSIVVIESCMRAQEKGLSFFDAAASGTREVIFSIFASTLTTIVVYISLGMSSGMFGQIATPLCWTIVLTMTSSFICAVIIVPLLFSRIKPVAKEDLPINKVLAKIQSFYRRAMPKLLRHPGYTVLIAFATLIVALILVANINFDTYPTSYDGSITISADFRSGTKLEVIDESIQEIEQALLADENFEDITLSISDNNASFTAYAVDGCDRSSEEAVEEYIKKFGSSENMELTASPTGKNNIGISTSSGTTSVTLMSDDLDTLEEGAALVEEVMSQVPGVIKVHNDFNQTRTTGRIIIDGQKALAMGTNQSLVAQQIYALLNGSTVATIDYEDKDTEYDVILEYPEGKYDDLIALMSHPISSTTGGQIMLNDIVTIEYDDTLPTISRQDGSFTTTISAYALEQYKYDVDNEINELVSEIDFPEGVGIGQSALEKMAGTETSNMATALFTGIFLVFLVMALQFNSPRLSLMVMMCIPLALVGSFGLVFISGETMSMVAVMGFLMLFGIVVNNGILLIDAIGEGRKTMPLEDALVSSGVTRLRPILMTTLTTIFSMLPMILRNSSGMAMMTQMAYVIIGGLFASTILTMFVMSPFYLLMRRENVDGTKKPPLLGRNKDNDKKEKKEKKERKHKKGKDTVEE
ncbi:MAG: efflux RND transporter permease subunit [Clostridiales bacterium]|nr:efflux RND transporter permease subunit [Clostridiales bacterium]